MKKLIHSAAIALVVLAATNQTNAQWTRSAPTQQTYLTNTGDNVGIGTTNPLFKLDIQSAAAATMSFKSTGGNANVIVDRFNSASTAGVNYRTNGVPYWQTGTIGTDNYVIRNIGLASPGLVIQYTTNNVGIGTSSPVNRLSVAGSANVDGSLLVRNSTTVTAYGQLTHSGSPNGNFHIDAYGSGGTYINAYSGQGVYIGDGGISSTAVAYFKTNGNVGIGTNTPNAPLQFSNSAVNRKVVLYDQNNNDNQYYGFGINGGTLRYQVDATAANHIFYAGASSTTSNELMRITGTGSVGIGTSTPAAKLDVNGGIKTTYFQMTTGAGVNKVLTSDANGLASWQTPSGGSGQWTTTGNNIYNNNIGNVGIGTINPNSKLDVEGNGAAGEVFRISNDKNGTMDSTLVMTGNGRVGIGTISPTSKLDVNGKVTIDQKNFGGYGGLLITGNAPGSNHPNIAFSLHNNAGNDIITGYIQGNPTNTNPGNESMDMAIYTSTTGQGGLTPRVYVKDDGKVGIGNTTPTEALDVTGNVQASGSIYVDAEQTNTGIAGDNSLRFGGPGSGELISSQRVSTFPGNQYGLDFYTASTKRMSIDVNGRVGIGTNYPGQQFEVYNGTTTGSYTTSGWIHNSDSRLKTNIKPIENSLQKILKLQGVSYNWKKNPDANPQIGFIAQEVEKVFPEVVVVDKDGNYSMAPQNLTGPIIEAIKELNNKLEAKDAIINDLKEENAIINNQLNDMQQCIQSLCESSAIKNSPLSNSAETTMLFQNQPNPFNQSTVIGYQLMSDSKNASIVIRNLNGELLKTVTIAQSGKGEVIINANELSQGTYTYTLMINNQSVDTKLMVITK